MSFNWALVVLGIGAIAALGILVVWVNDRTTERLIIEPGPTDPIRGARDRVAIYESQGPFIAMPAELKTRDEMVAWMTKELPKLTADQPK